MSLFVGWLSLSRHSFGARPSLNHILANTRSTIIVCSKCRSDRPQECRFGCVRLSLSVRPIFYNRMSDCLSDWLSGPNHLHSWLSTLSASCKLSPSHLDPPTVDVDHLIVRLGLSPLVNFVRQLSSVRPATKSASPCLCLRVALGPRLRLPHLPHRGLHNISVRS